MFAGISGERFLKSSSLRTGQICDHWSIVASEMRGIHEIAVLGLQAISLSGGRFLETHQEVK